MARHSELRFEVGKQMAGLAVLLLNATRTNANKLEKIIRAELAEAAGYISKGDITELSRRHIFAHARVARFAADQDKGKYADALATFGEALADYATGTAPDYIPALHRAQNAVQMAREA